MKITDTSDLWWKTAVIYCLDVETYMDGNDDGVGDFEGLARRIDYLADLGITCLWLMPFYPSPDRDDGYDISDFYGIDPRLGNHGDFVEVIRTARDRGMRVIVDLVVNHTSDKHPWFVSARRSRTSAHRDFYVWRDAPPKKQQPTVFPGEEASVWEYDERTEQYFQHVFYKHQPDLNIANPRVRDEIAKTIGFWLALGVSGFRIDAVPFLIEPPDGVELGDPHEFLRDLKRFLQHASAMPRCSERSTSPSGSSCSSSAASAAASSTCSSTSCRCRRCTSRSCGAIPHHSSSPSRHARPCRRRRRGRTSFATTMS